ncbi:MAG: hypothetical protein Q8N98_02280 [bacterium]|nr:hypothetical protein [bacterium]
MKIYIAHSNNFDYKNELYVPLRKSPLSSRHEIFLPYENDKFVNTKEIIKRSDAVIAEVSYPSTGEGIELGWADDFGITILCLYKEGTKLSRSLKAITDKVVSYFDDKDMLNKIESFLSQNDLSALNPLPDSRR